MQSTNPYKGRYGPRKNPGFIHLWLGLEDEKYFLKKSSIIHPIMLPTENKNANVKNKFIIKI